MLKDPQTIDPDDNYPDSLEVDDTNFAVIRNEILEAKPDGVFIKYFD